MYTVLHVVYEVGMTNTEHVLIAGAHAELLRVTDVLAQLLRGSGPSSLEAPGPSVPTVPAVGTQPERVLAYVRQFPSGCSREQLREAFPDLNQNSLSGAITRLKDRGQLEALGRGRYRAVRGA